MQGILHWLPVDSQHLGPAMQIIDDLFVPNLNPIFNKQFLVISDILIISDLTVMIMIHQMTGIFPHLIYSVIFPLINLQPFSFTLEKIMYLCEQYSRGPFTNMDFFLIPSLDK